jgi:predicted ATPase
MTARLVELRIRGLRTLADVTLRLGGLTVLIGDNGTGKSSILEALRIARLVGERDFMGRLSSEHMLLFALRTDATGLKLDLRVEKADRNFVYSLSVHTVGWSITHEAIHEVPIGCDLRTGADGVQPMLVRNPTQLRLPGSETIHPILETTSILEHLHPRDFDAIAITREALDGIDVHLPFDVSATWAAHSRGKGSALREPRVAEFGRRLDLFGTNLVNVYQMLKNSGFERWRETLELLQLGLGPELQDVLLPVVGGGYLGIELELRGRGRIPAYQLADGELAYLAFVGLVQLDEGRTMLCFDEPEHHLHPGLLGRVVQLFEDASTRYPVVLATHSDRLLDFVPDPASEVRVCELDSQYRTVLRQLDRAQLEKWTDRYSGLGELRAAGNLSAVMAMDEDNAVLRPLRCRQASSPALSRRAPLQ